MLRRVRCCGFERLASSVIDMVPVISDQATAETRHLSTTRVGSFKANRRELAACQLEAISAAGNVHLGGGQPAGLHYFATLSRNNEKCEGSTFKVTC